MFYHYELDPDDDLHMDFTDLLKKAFELLGTKKKLVDLVRTNKKTDRIEDLIDKCKKNNQICSAINHSTPLPESTFQILVAIFINTIYSGLAHFQPLNKHQLIDMLQGLVLSVHILQNKAIIFGRDFRSVITKLALMSALAQRFDWPDNITKCPYCWVKDHYLKRHCSIFQEDLNTTQIYFGTNRKVCVGLYTPGARLIFIRKKKPSQESVADAKILRYPTLPFAEIYILKIGQLQPDPYSLNKENKYISLNTSLDVTVFVALFNQNKKSDSSGKEPIKQILHRWIQKKDGYITPKKCPIWRIEASRKYTTIIGATTTSTNTFART